jgi:hypothetical protein
VSVLDPVALALPQAGLLMFVGQPDNTLISYGFATELPGGGDD